MRKTWGNKYSWISEMFSWHLDTVRLTFDPNTAYKELALSNGNRRVIRKRMAQFYPDHPDRFDGFCQVFPLDFGDISMSFLLCVVNRWKKVFPIVVGGVIFTFYVFNRSSIIEISITNNLV